jgi:multidrug efflux system outer membrane protein
VQLALIAEVASAYLLLAADQEQQRVAEATLMTREDYHALTKKRFELGAVSALDLSQARTQMESARAESARYAGQVALDTNVLNLLVGAPVGTDLLPAAFDQPVTGLAALPAGLPSEVLLRRPDVLAAEHLMRAANASIGAARALYYPTISLTGLLGSVSTAFGDFLSGPAQAWSLAAGLTGPIFTFGAIEGQVRSAEAAERQALAFYQQAILNAFRETNDALVGSQNKQEEAAVQAKRVVALREFARLSRRRFDAGLAGYLDVLVAENELFAAELVSVRTLAERNTQVVGVYQAMGGGWVDIAGSIAPKPQGVAAAR